MVCSWELPVKASVHLSKSLSLIHLHVLFVSLFSISLANCPCILFAAHSFFLYSLVFLNSLGSTVSSFVIVPYVLTETSNGSNFLFYFICLFFIFYFYYYFFLTYHPSLFSSLFTLFSYPISPLPPYFLETYNCPTSLLGCNSLFIVMNFLVFVSVSFSSFLFHLSIPAPYLKIDTAHKCSVPLSYSSHSVYSSR